jgi:hypothetical protein
MTFAEVVMAEQGIDIGRDPFRVKLTGGPNPSLTPAKITQVIPA